MGKKLFPGELLPGLITSHGQQKITHGGTAILAPEQTTRPFTVDEDCTQKYARLFASKRVNACWIQVLPRLRVLVFSVYARTGASQDSTVHTFNDELLADIFEVCSQFGDCPIVVAGDLQAFPLSYESISNAILFNKWVDPLLAVDDAGQNHRPLTFSNDGSFTGLGERCSSIDAMILNCAAASALVDMHVDELFHIQHRPIHATFEWSRVCQAGHVLYKFAALNISNLPQRTDQHAFQSFEDSSKALWEKHYQHKFIASADVDEQWKLANDYCIQTVISSGAKWENGPRFRAVAPVFKTKQHCPGQCPTGSATTLRLSWLYNSLQSIHELQIRFSRPTRDGPDAHVTFRTINKLRHRLEALECPQCWSPFELPNLVVLDQCEKWLTQQITTTEHAVKMKRICLWKSKIRASLKQHKSYIFKHLRNKNLDEPANLVSDEHDNILYQPDCAMKSINSQWDDVFAANAGYPHPLKMLEVVWPYIQDHTCVAKLQPITAADLQNVVLQRNPESAPGLDGWRTHELQALPLCCFEPFAHIFRELEENQTPLPKTLVCARQMILNKNGSSSPMDKRLITIMPILLLAYTGSRFRHLQSWQMQCMPQALQGGIPKRKMEAVHTHMRLAIDQAQVDKQPLVGVKIDKSKCFDRIIPSYAAALMLSYGVPKRVVSFFVKIYNGLHKHLSYKSWIAANPTKGANGVAQGCSLSLIAINVYMKTWCHLLEHLPDVTMKAFVDDSYLWAHLSHVHLLEQAIAITKMWDELSGQKLNDNKSTIWATTAKARKVIKKSFPHMKIALSFDVLGTLIRTANVSCHFLTDEKVTKICVDAKNIAALPIPTKSKSDLVGAKVITQCTYGATINVLPKTTLGKIQSAVAQTLWFKRPHWRSKWLLFALLHKPHRVEPKHAAAYCAIMDFVRFLRDFPQFASKCSMLLDHVADNHYNYMRSIVEALNLFGIRVDHGLMISFGSSTKVPLVDFQPRDLRRTLQSLARNACYHQATHHTRKDFTKPKGILDHDLTSVFWRFSKLQFDNGLPATTFFDAQVVGCLLTKDRLHAASCVDDPHCRFCDYEKESLNHLVQQCTYVKQEFGSFPSHELGVNFNLLGIIDHPKAIVSHRLRWSDPQLIDIQLLDDGHERVTLWTDGSVFWSDVHWLTTGGFAIVDVNQKVILSGPVCHWSLTSYTTELWAILQACAIAKSKVLIASDCMTVVGQCWLAMEYNSIPSDWSHQTWWKFFLHMWQTKFKSDCNLLEICWVPAHLYEGIPVELITVEMANAHDTTVQDIACNRRADFAAKDAAHADCAVDPNFKENLFAAILRHQEFLAKLAYHVGIECAIPLPPEKFDERQEVDLHDDNAIIDFFPNWNWNAASRSFGWKAKFSLNVPPPERCALDNSDWKTFLQFLRALKWKCAEGEMTSFAELACLFVLKGFKWSWFDPDSTTFTDLIPAIRKAFSVLRHVETNLFFPGAFDPYKAKSFGKTMPPGVIFGAVVFVSHQEMLALGRFFLKGVSSTLRTWNFSLSEIGACA